MRAADLCALTPVVWFTGRGSRIFFVNSEKCLFFVSKNWGFRKMMSLAMPLYLDIPLLKKVLG